MQDWELELVMQFMVLLYSVNMSSEGVCWGVRSLKWNLFFFFGLRKAKAYLKYTKDKGIKMYKDQSALKWSEWKNPRPHNPIKKSLKEKQLKLIGGMPRILEMSSISLSPQTPNQTGSLVGGFPRREVFENQKFWQKWPFFDCSQGKNSQCII